MVEGASVDVSQVLPVMQNGHPLCREFDGVEMVLVPAGCFMMGRNKNEMNNLFMSSVLTLRSGLIAMK